MPVNEVDHALAADPEDTGPALLACTEDQWFERKSSRCDPRDLAKVLVAFANAEGGDVVLGLYSGRVEGIDRTRRENAWRQASIDHASPAVRVRPKSINCVNDEGDADHLLVLRVEPSESVHETKKSDCYLRVGDETRKLNFVQRQELEYDKGQAQWDGKATPEVAITDLNKSLLDQYRSSTGADSPIERILTARSLYTRRGEITNAAYLLFGSNPQDLFPEAYVRVLRFLSSERGTGSRLGLDDESDFRIGGPIPLMIEEAADVIRPLIPRRRHLAASGVFEPSPLVPTDAWLEGLVNAVIHRSYSLSGDHIRVEVYPNRIVIESPGRFPGLANPASPLDIARFARNPRIARVCADLRIGQELGEGIRRIFEEMRAVGLTDPIYAQTEGSVRLTLQAIPRLDPRLLRRLPRGSQQTLEYLRNASRPLGTGDLANALGVSRPTMKRRLEALRQENLVQWSGNSARDPRATWDIVGR
jgi:ATP-dependent DNA helicase RecG